MTKLITEDDRRRDGHIAKLMELYRCDEREATIRLDSYENGRRSGVEQGRAEAQRFFRLALGVEEPSLSESAYWNNPVPLRRKTRDG